MTRCLLIILFTAILVFLVVYPAFILSGRISAEERRMNRD